MDEFAKRRRHRGGSFDPPWTAARAVLQEDGWESVGSTARGAAPAAARPVSGRRSLHARLVSGPDLREAVDRELFRLLPRGEPTIDAVAKALVVPRDMLAQRLSDEGTTFREALADLRRRLALRYVEGTTLAVDQIAMLLGYSHSASFRHAFRRWTGASPVAARRQAVSA